MSTTTLSNSSSDQASREHGPGIKIYIAFIPWVLFALIDRHSTLKGAALAALAGSIIIALPSLLARRAKLLELGPIVAFAGFAVAAFSVDPAAGHWLARYARAIAAALLALIAFSSLLLVPFTEQYARESVPRQFWSSPRFKQINQQLTLMWALVFTALVPSHLVAGALNTHQANLIFNWAIPIALIMLAAKRTAAISTPEATPSVNGPR